MKLFFLLQVFLYITLEFFYFQSFASNCFIDAFIYLSSGYISYGILPLVFSYLNLTNKEYNYKNKENVEINLGENDLNLALLNENR